MIIHKVRKGFKGTLHRLYTGGPLQYRLKLKKKVYLNFIFSILAWLQSILCVSDWSNSTVKARAIGQIRDTN